MYKWKGGAIRRWGVSKTNEIVSIEQYCAEHDCHLWKDEEYRFEVYRQVQPDEIYKPLAENIRQWNGQSLPQEARIRIKIPYVMIPDTTKAKLREVGLLEPGYPDVLIPLSTRSAMWDGERSSTRRDYNYTWIEVYDPNNRWVVCIPLHSSSEVVGGERGYGAPNKIIVDGAWIAECDRTRLNRERLVD